MTGNDPCKPCGPACDTWQADDEIAVAALKQGASVAIAKGGRLLGTAQGKGVLPLLQVLRQIGDDASGAVFADRVVGKAAAMVMVDAKAASVHTFILSEPGAAVLEQHGIPYIADKVVEFIINRTGTGMCPIEQISLEWSDCRGLRHALEKKFLQQR